MNYRPTSSFTKKRAQTADPHQRTRPGTAKALPSNRLAPEDDQDHEDHSDNENHEQGAKPKNFKIRNKDKEDQELLKVVIKKVG